VYYRLALKNLQSQKLRTFLTTLGLTVGIASLVVFTGLSAGMRQAIYENILNSGPLTELTVQGKSSGTSLLSFVPMSQVKARVTPEMMDTIQKIPHVRKVTPEMGYNNVSSLQIGMVGQTYLTDTMIFGLSSDYLQDTLTTPELKAQWDNASRNYPQQPYPAILSRRIIDLYNFTIASSTNLPRLTEKDLIGLEFTLLPDESTFLNNVNTTSNPLKTRLVGFSDKTTLVGVTIPIDVVRELNRRREPGYTDSYLRLYVETDSAEYTNEVEKDIQAMGLETTSAQAQIKTFEQNFRFVNVGLGMISLTILIVAGLMIANTFFSTVSERKNEIGIFRALGATRRHIRMIFLTEAGLLGVIGGIIGIIVGLAGEFVLNIIAMNILPDVTDKPDSIFANDPVTVGAIFLFSIILSTLFAYIPAARASHLEPLEALNE
jgi:ABC-type antimicrobial peptide transport system permease subunit